MSDKFLGSWLVSEYVYEPNGRFAGIIRQRRELAQLDNGHIRVTQHCYPEATLDGHVMAQFAGKWVFELSVNGRYRHYHGPAVVGYGIAWGEGSMTGSGLWPQFGHNFRSFALLGHRQLTGGQFFNASEMVANIIGVGIAEDSGSDWPILSQRHWLETKSWRGTLQSLHPTTPSQPLARIYQGQEGDWVWEERQGQTTQFHLHLHRRADGCWEITGYGAPGQKLAGLGRQIGPLLEIEAFADDGVRLHLLELADEQSGERLGLRRWYRHDELERVELVRLQG